MQKRCFTDGSPLTGTSLVTPTGETRSNTLTVLALLKLKHGSWSQSHSHYLKADTHTRFFCAGLRAFAFYAATLPLFCELQKHRATSSQRERCATNEVAYQEISAYF